MSLSCVSCLLCHYCTQPKVFVTCLSSKNLCVCSVSALYKPKMSAVSLWYMGIECLFWMQQAVPRPAAPSVTTPKPAALQPASPTLIPVASPSRWTIAQRPRSTRSACTMEPHLMPSPSQALVSVPPLPALMRWVRTLCFSCVSATQEIH